jgi:hypothetical protein
MTSQLYAPPFPRFPSVKLSLFLSLPVLPFDLTDSDRPRGFQRDVVYLCWPIAPSYTSPNAGGWVGGLRGLSQWVQLCTSRHVTWSPNKLGNLPLYLTYADRNGGGGLCGGGAKSCGGEKSWSSINRVILSMHPMSDITTFINFFTIPHCKEDPIYVFPEMNRRTDCGII